MEDRPTDDPHLEIKVLGGWRARRGGDEVIKGENMQPVLHALILGEGRLTRMDLCSLLPNIQTYDDKGKQTLSDALTALRHDYELDITHSHKPVLAVEQPRARIDIFDFFAFAETERYPEAWALIERGQVPETPLGPDEFWTKTLQRFERCRAEVERAVKGVTRRGAVMRGVREHLLNHTLVAGVGPETPIGQIREQLDSITSTWQSVRPQIEEVGPLPTYLRNTLVDGVPAPRIVVVGAPGSGKALTAISTFLRLTDILDQPREPGELRTVLFVDARTEATQEGFGGEEWLERRLAAAGHEASDGRAIAIVPHADAYLARSGRPTRESLQLPLFTKTDVLLCCNELHYEQVLRFTQYGTHVVRLLPCGDDQQRTYVLALYDQQMLDAFVAWRAVDEARKMLCRVPLHLTYVLWLLDMDNKDSAKHRIERISGRAQLLESVARMRIKTQGVDGSELDTVMNELGSVAHRFNRSSSPGGLAITFPSQALREYLDEDEDHDTNARYDTLTRKTLLGVSEEGADEVRFEDALWGWFFTAYHLVRTIQSSGTPSAVLKAFERLYWPNVMGLCEELLRDRLQLNEEAIVTSLREALEATPAPGIAAARRRIAREQIAYLLGVLANAGLREQLAMYFDASSPAYEEDRLVRRALFFGLANGDGKEFADRYAEELRAEREQPAPSPLADTNVGFLLGYCGDQAFDLDEPDRIEPGVEPSRLVAKLAKSLDQERHRGSQRLKLATLIDMASPERIEQEQFVRAVALHRAELLEVLDRLGERKVEGRWPEIDELREILKAVAPWRVAGLWHPQ